MTSIEAQKSLTNSLHLQNSVISESQKENSQLTNVQEEQDIDIANKETSRDTIIDIKNDIKDALHIKNCDQKKYENEEDVIILENNKKDIKCNINKIEHGQNSEKLDIISFASENDSKIIKTENTKEVTNKSGNNLKRTRRSIT